MRKTEDKKRTRVAVTAGGVVIVSFALVGAIALCMVPSFRVGLKNLIARELVQMDFPIQEKIEVIYVLGGGDRSTRRHLRCAAEFYCGGIAEKILYFHGTGAMKYDRSLQRNITRHEWVVKELAKYGVPASAAESVPVPEGFFGTYSEAEAVSRLLLERRAKSILLITSPYHTKRVRKCFDYFLSGKGVSVFVSGSNDRSFLRGHLAEYLKLKIYDCFLLRGSRKQDGPFLTANGSKLKGKIICVE